MKDPILTEEEKALWRADEERWWNRHGGHMTYQWEMTPELHRAVRAEMDQDRDRYLLHPGESILDLGCGQGALALHFAASGMTVFGIDHSGAQMAAAEAKARAMGVPVIFECADVVSWDVTHQSGRFDNVFVNAFLHHLPPGDLDLVLGKLAFVLKPGGRLYLYEPLWSTAKRGFWPKVVDYATGRILDLILNRLPARLGWISVRHREALARGFTPSSPREAPLDLDLLYSLCDGRFDIVEVRPWHLHSIGFAMQAMTLSDAVRGFYVPWAWFWYKLDRTFLALLDWRKFSGPRRFVLCGVKLRRRS